MLLIMSAIASIITVQHVYGGEGEPEQTALIVISDEQHEVQLTPEEFVAIVDSVFAAFGADEEPEEDEEEPAQVRRLVVRPSAVVDAD